MKVILYIRKGILLNKIWEVKQVYLTIKENSIKAKVAYENRTYESIYK